jgi:regulator of sirC expression with transglutaminase-like and TPR domain
MAAACMTVACVEKPQPLGPIARVLIEVAAEASGPINEAEVRRELGLLERRVIEARKKARAEIGDDTVGGPADASALARALYDESAFVREVTSTDLRHVLLPDVLASRKGSCVGLGTLYLALGERLGIPLEGVVVPGHFFVRARTAGGEVRNLETLRQGEVMPDSFYRDKYDLPNRAAPAFSRPLSAREIAGVVRFNVGNERRRANRLTEAARLYRRAAEDFPQFGEAHASLGLVLQLQGDRAGARVAYEAAAKVEPNLPGLARNVELLEGEAADARPMPTKP